MAHDVFVSYASGDKPVADAVCATLESHDIRCWIAPRDVLPGIHYGEAIIDAIHECRIMVLVFSSKANLSGHIPKEIERAVSQGCTVMPLRIEDVAPAKSLDYFIGGVHWLDALTPPLEAHLERLAANVRTLLSRSDTRKEPRPSTVFPLGPSAASTKAPTPPVPPPADKARAAHPTWAYVVIGGLVAIVAALGFVMYRSRSPVSPSVVAQLVSSVPAAPLAAPAVAPAEVPKKIGELEKGTPVSAAPAKTSSEAHAAVLSAALPSPSPAISRTTPAAKPAAPPATPAREETRQYVPDSTVKLEQLIGDLDKELRKPTPGQTLTRFGVEGTELGNSFEHQGHAYFLFGPTVGHLPQEADTVASTAGANPEEGVQLDFLMNAGSPVFILPSGVTMALLDVPVAGISLNRQMYVAVSTNFTKSRDMERTVLAKFAAPNSFQTVRTISELPGGRFIRMSMREQPGSVAGLPSGGPFILSWGTGKYRESDAYLSVTPASQFEAGKGTRYFAGLDAANAPTWGDNESDATAIVKDGSLGDLSVTWCKDLGLWLMTYDRRTEPNGIAFSYSRTPWGPWSEPQILFNAMRDKGFGRFIHNPARRRDDGLEGPILGARNNANPAQVHGGAFAPYVVERWTKVQGSELDLYYVMSTMNPYVVVLMKSRLTIQ